MSIRDKGGEEEILCLEAISWQRGRGEMDLAENNSPGPLRAIRKVPERCPSVGEFAEIAKWTPPPSPVFYLQTSLHP